MWLEGIVYEIGTDIRWVSTTVYVYLLYTWMSVLRF